MEASTNNNNNPQSENKAAKRRDPVIGILIAIVVLLLAGIAVLNFVPLKTPAPVITPEPEPEIIEPDPASLSLTERLARVPLSSGEWDIFVLDLADREYAAMEPGHPSVSASLIKLFIMGAVYDRFADDYGDIGEHYDTVVSMIRNSDNEAANELTRILGDGDETIGRARVTGFARSLGCNYTTHNRLMLEDNGTENYTSARDCANLLSKICGGKLVSAASSLKMLEILSENEYSNGLDRLPADAKVYHKTGNLLSLVCGDAGIIVRDGHAWIFCAICNNQTSEKAPQDSIEQLSNEIYSYMANKYDNNR